LSPLAWAQQTRLYVDLRWWPLLVSAAATVVLLTAAIFLAQRRDLGAGIRQGKAGPASASPALLSPAGLARRLLNGSFLAWAIGTFVFAVAFGALADSLEAMIDDIPELAEWISVDLADLTSGFASAMLSFLAIGPVIYPVAAVLRLRSEEEAGRIEAMVVTGSSRPALLGGWLAVVAAQTVVITAGAGLGVGLGVSAVTGEGSWIGQLTLASLAYLPAALLVAAVAVALYGAMPRTAGLSWVLVVWVAGTLFLGELLNLPDWAMDLSPVSHVPAVPNEDLAAAPLIVMGLAAVVIVAVGIAGFRRRDIGVTSS
jgi:ABC-2 type transport system permease protein